MQKRAPGASGAPQPVHFAEAGGGVGVAGGGPGWGVGLAVGGAGGGGVDVGVGDVKVDGGGWLAEACCC